MRSKSGPPHGETSRHTGGLAMGDPTDCACGGRTCAQLHDRGVDAHNEPMSEVRHTDIEMANPSTPRQRIDAAQRRATSEVAHHKQAVNVRVGSKGTQVGDDSRLWWPVTYEVVPKCIADGSRARH